MGYAQPNYNKTPLPQPITVVVNIATLDAAALAALQTQLTTAYGDLSFTSTGVDFKYQITLVGSTRSITGSIKIIQSFAPTYTIQPNIWGPTLGAYDPGNYPPQR